MSNPSSFNGSFTPASFAALMRDTAARRLSGRLRLEGSAGQGSLSFIQGKLVAAQTNHVEGEAAYAELLSWSGQFAFVEAFVKLSELPVRSRISAGFDAAGPRVAPASIPSSPLTAPSPGTVQDPVRDGAAPISVTPSSIHTPPSVPTPRADIPIENELDIFELGAFEPEPANEPSLKPGFVNAVTALFVRNVGPAGYVVLEDVAQDAGVALNAVPPKKALTLIAALTQHIPSSARAAFQSACMAYLEQFKP
jgi:Domain of unknown function (DUF4388)